MADRLQAVPIPAVRMTGGFMFVLRQIRATLRRAAHPVLLHAHGPRMNVLAALAARGTGVPWTSTIHSDVYQDFLRKRWKSAVYPRLVLAALRSASGVFVVHPRFASFFPGKWTCPVPHALEVAPLPEPRQFHRQRLRARLGVGEDAVVIGIAARFDPVKDIVTAVRALRHLSPAVHLALAGDGPEREAILHTAAACGVTDRVHLLGFLDDVRPFYAGIDLHVLPSRSEGVPSALLEAGWFGVPNIGSDIPGVRYLVEDGVTGRCFPVGDDLALASVIDELVRHPEEARRLAERFRAEVLPRFTPDSMLRAYLDGYERLWRDVIRAGCRR